MGNRAVISGNDTSFLGKDMGISGKDANVLGMETLFLAPYAPLLGGNSPKRLPMSDSRMKNTDNPRPRPPGWRWVRLGEVCERVDYGYTASADFTVTEPRFLRITDIQDGKVNWDSVPGCRISIRETEVNALSDGDIVFARTGGTTGKSFLIRDPPPSVFASYLIRLRVKREVDAEYLYAFFQSDGYWRQIRTNARGGAQPNVNATLLSNLDLPLPPLPEQRRIAAILTEQMAAVERARKAAEEQLAAAKALPAAYLRTVFNSEEARKWERRRLGEIAVLVQNGIYKSAEHYGYGHPFLRMYNVVNHSWDLDLSRLAQVNLDSREEEVYRLRVGDLLISRVNSFELVGKCARVGPDAEDYVFENMLIRVRLAESVESLFVAQQMATREVREQVERVAKRAIGQASINSEDLRNIQFVVPPLPTQRRVAAMLTDQMAQAEKVRKGLEEQLDALNKLPAALLRRAFNGEV